MDPQNDPTSKLAENNADAQNPKEEEEEYEGTSIRWKHFITSYRLAAKKISMGWSYEDFAQCIPNWPAADPGAGDVSKQMSTFLHDYILENGQEILRSYHAAEAIDTLHQVVAEGRERVAAGEPFPKDAWTKVLEPKTAIRAKVVPTLQDEKARLEGILAELETENEQLTETLRENKKIRAEQNALANQWLDALEETASSFSKMPDEQIHQWSIEAQETRP